MVYWVRQVILLRLKRDASVIVFFPLPHQFLKPLITGAFFCPDVRR